VTAGKAEDAPALSLDGAFLAALERLARVARRARKSARAARRRRPEEHGAASGAGVVRDRRPYAAGDDLRAVDWPLYARLGRLLVKIVEPEEPRDVLVCIDVSASMGTPARKLAHARRAAAAVAVIALARPARAGLWAFSDRVVDALPPRAGKGVTARALAFLDGLDAEGGGALPTAPLEEIARRVTRPSLAVVVTDALWPGDVARPLARLSAAGHVPALIRIDDAGDRAPALEGAIALSSAETGARLEVDAGPTFLDAFAEAARLHEEAVLHACRRAGASLTTIPTDASIEAGILALLDRAPLA